MGSGFKLKAGYNGMFTVFGNPYIMDFYFHKNEMFYCVLQFVQKRTSR